MYEIGQIINHKTLGRGQIIYTQYLPDVYGRQILHFDVHFDKDEKYKVRMFTPNSIEGFLVEEPQPVLSEE